MTRTVLALTVLAGLFVGLAIGEAVGPDQSKAEFSDSADIDNRYYPLTRFERCVLRGKEDGSRIRVVRTSLSRTKGFVHDGEPVRAAIVKDREFEDGELVERTFDYFAQDDRGTVWYLGEDVDEIEDGKVVGHDGSWLYGRDTDAMGVGMPAHPQVGSRWRHEDVPNGPFESDKVVAVLDRATVRGKTYRDVLKVRERSRPGNGPEFKLYAPGVGNIEEQPPDGRIGLVGCEKRRSDDG
jgi:hypothetical protein